MKRNTDIDLKLAVLCHVAEADETMNTYEIAEFCGCSHQLIQAISKKAMKKLERSEKLQSLVA